MAIQRRTRVAVRVTPLWPAYHRLRYTILFYALLLFLLIMPLVTALGLPGVLIRLHVGACLTAAVMPSATRRTWRIVLAVVLLLVVAQIMPDWGGPPATPAVVLALTALTLQGAAAGALRFALSSKTVTSETVYAALSTYLLAGISFGQIYWMTEILQPGSIVGPDPFSEANAVYFSFVTQTTLGYGDFLPRTAVTRGIVAFEVIGGQLFLAVLVARLIGIFRSGEL